MEEKGMKGRRKGFTLVELMIVIVIMTILAAAATPIFSGYVRKAKATEHLLYKLSNLVNVSEF